MFALLHAAGKLGVSTFLHQWHRTTQVLVGPYADRSSASQVQAKLAAAGLPGFVRSVRD